MASSAIDLMVSIIEEHTPKDIWRGSPLICYRMLGNTNRGEIGEAFVRRYLRAHDIAAGNAGRTSRSDMRIEGVRFEIKTASLGADGTFQFNHVRLDRRWAYLLCLGICPDRILVRVWTKGAVAEGDAGRLVRMAEGQAVTFKLTKRPEDLMAVEDLPATIRELLHL